MNPWLVAARPPTLLAAVAPVLVGGGLAVDDGVFRPDAFAVALVAAVLINVAANFANDASDARRGADGPHRIGPPRAVASGLLTARQVWTGTALVVAVAAGGGLYLAAISSWWLLAPGAAALLAMVGYTGGPRPYGYYGFGEVAVFVFFGLFAVVGSRFVHDSAITGAAWLLAIPVGFLVTAILVANNVRDIDTDHASGKRTLAVRIGRGATRALFTVLVLGAFALIAAFAAAGWTPGGTLLGLLALPLAAAPIRTVATVEHGPALIVALKATARLHALVGLLVGVGAAL